MPKQLHYIMSLKIISNPLPHFPDLKVLTHRGRVMQIYVSKQTSIDSDNGLSPGRRQAIIWTNAGLLLIEPLGTNFSEIYIEIHIHSFKKMHLKMSSGIWRPSCLGLNELTSITGPMSAQVASQSSHAQCYHKYPSKPFNWCLVSTAYLELGKAWP